ncbi:MAG TPA: YceD family protein [Candidatus Limnocylindrales bacterium]|jgi:uncharacterized protein
MTGGQRRGARPPDDQPLVWNVAGLLGEPPGSHRDYAFDGVTIDLGEDLRLASPIAGRVHLARTNRGLLVDADASTTLAEQCARCLRDIVVPVSVELETEALPSIDLQSGSPVRLAPEDADEDVILLSDHHELDLERSIREAILLAEPIAPLCREDCPGLCVTCGLPLDEGEHLHHDEEIDPRLEALKAFRPAGD